jgi:hypothetical protein
MALIGAIFYGEQVALIQYQRGASRREGCLFPDSRARSPAHFGRPRASDKQVGPANFCPKLTLFAAGLVLLIGRAGALRLIRLRFFGLLGWFVFSLGHCPLLIST